jgi:hypothetical protein
MSTFTMSPSSNARLKTIVSNHRSSLSITEQSDVLVRDAVSHNIVDAGTARARIAEVS